MTLKELTNAEFKEFSQNFGLKSMYQTINYGFTMNEENYDTLFLGLVDGNTIKAASLILVTRINGFKYAHAPRGFLIDFNDFELVAEFTKQIKKFLGKMDIVAVKMSPLLIKNIYDANYKLISTNGNYNNIYDNLKRLKYYHLGYNNYFEALKPRYEAVIDISTPYSDLFAGMDEEFRENLKEADKNGVKIYHGNINHLEYLYNQTKDKYPRDLNYFKRLYKFFDNDSLIDFYYSKLDTTEYLQLTQRLYSEYEKKAFELNSALIYNHGDADEIMNEKIIVDNMFEKYKLQLADATNYLRDYPNGIILSSALIIKWQDEVYLIIDGYNEDFKFFNARNLLVWKLLVRYSKLGFKKFNLGGMINPEKVTKKYQSLIDFKLGFNPNIIEYAGDFELVTNTPLYFMYQRSSNFNNMIKPGQ